jgi:nitroimidazol reductase NimA-like FMN-containing flavoprotein (pyridoxamine 5'-phosphate oxidase superfamily)
VNGFWDRSIAKLLATARIAYLAVETSSGPHVTPLLFAATPDRLWFGIGRRTLKARALAKRPAVGVVVAGPNGAVSVRGQATLLDNPARSATELARTPMALPAFASRNALEMAAFARDIVGERTQPPTLVPVSVRPDSVELLDGWPADAVLGWSPDGAPIALPASWDPGTRRARVPAEPLRSAGGPRTAAACLCVDESEGRGPLAKRGSLLRGTGHARLRGEVAVITLETERVTRWKGFQTRTTPAAAS